MTLRQVVQRLAAPRGAFVGTAERIADTIQAWFEAKAADGFVLFEPLPGQLARFVDQVVPILQQRGLFRADYESGATFRDTIGLPFPENRHAVARKHRDVA